MSTEPTRRSVLVAALALAAGGGGAWWLLRERRAGRALAELGGLAGELGLGSGSALGEAYLASFPEEAEAAALVRALGLPPGVDAGGGAAREALAERIRRDWAERDLVRLEGWLLARSEGRLLALAALEARAGASQ